MGTIEELIVFLSFLFIHYITERRQIEIKDGIIIVTPPIGGRREVPCEEIKEIVIHKSPGISVFTLMKSNGKRHARFSTWHWGWEDFMKELEEYDIPRIEIKE